MKTGICPALLAVGLAAMAIAMPARPAADNGNLMELTVHVTETTSGKAAMPPRTMQKKVCTHPGAFDPRAFAKAESRSVCRIRNYVRHGNVVAFDIACTGAEPVTSHAEFHLSGGADFTGTMHTEFDAAGHAIAVETAYAGKRIGTCRYTPPAASR